MIVDTGTRFPNRKFHVTYIRAYGMVNVGSAGVGT